MQPFVSVLMPTYNRRKFIPTAIEIYKNQTYPKHRMEWIILDDGSDKVEDLFKPIMKQIPNIRYIYQSEKQTIGAKRNKLLAEAKGDIIVWMDDDDYYFPNRVEHVVDSLIKSKANIAGCSGHLMYDYDLNILVKLKPFGQFHSINSCMGWKKQYLLTNSHPIENLINNVLCALIPSYNSFCLFSLSFSLIISVNLSVIPNILIGSYPFCASLSISIISSFFLVINSIFDNPKEVSPMPCSSCHC